MVTGVVGTVGIGPGAGLEHCSTALGAWLQPESAGRTHLVSACGVLSCSGGLNDAQSSWAEKCESPALAARALAKECLGGWWSGWSLPRGCLWNKGRAAPVRAFDFELIELNCGHKGSESFCDLVDGE